MSNLHPNYALAKLNRFVLTSVLLLVALLFSSVGHSHEYSFEQSHSVEQLDCKLCQQQVDTPKQAIKVAKVTFGLFSAVKESLVQRSALAANYPLSNPRAPPSIT